MLNWGEPLGGTDLILEAPPLACGASPLFWMVYLGKVLIIQRGKMLETIRSMNTSRLLQDIVVIVGSLTQYTSTAILPERF